MIANTASRIVYSSPFAMYQKFSAMKPKSRSDSARNKPRMKKTAIHVAVTLTRNGTLEAARARASLFPAAGAPSSSRITATALSAAATYPSRSDVRPPAASRYAPEATAAPSATHQVQRRGT
jgi:hypothetical protein